MNVYVESNFVLEVARDAEITADELVTAIETRH